MFQDTLTSREGYQEDRNTRRKRTTGKRPASALGGHDTVPLTREDFDVTDHDRARTVLTDLRPEMIVNLTAYHRVDDCEIKCRARLRPLTPWLC